MRDPAGRSGDVKKRAGRLASAGVILEAAATLFLRNGYPGTSMDEIAGLAGVSKQTVYTHFADKQRLFTALVLRNTERVDEFVDAMSVALQDTQDVEKGLRQLARRYLSSVLQPQVLQLRRLMVGEAGRFPELAETYYERVPARTLEALASQLKGLDQRGLLRLAEPRLAADHFAALVLWVPLDQAMFRANDPEFTADQLERFANSGVDVFLAAYGRKRPAAQLD